MIIGGTGAGSIHVRCIRVDPENKAIFAGIVGKLERAFPLTAANIQDALAGDGGRDIHCAAPRMAAHSADALIMRAQGLMHMLVHGYPLAFRLPFTLGYDNARKHKARSILRL